MSATALPITSSRFAAALRELPISSLHAKVLELQNAIAHLDKSNAELEEFVRKENDKDCYEALMENKELIEKNKERIELIRKEVVELRGLPWVEDQAKPTTTAATKEADVGMADSETGLNGAAGGASVRPQGSVNTDANGQTPNLIIGATSTETEEGVFL